MYVFYLLLVHVAVGIFAVPISTCPENKNIETRTLHIITCDTRDKYKEYHALASKLYLGQYY